MNTTVGTCGLCGGPVLVPSAWYGLIPTTPTCAHCGASAKPSYGPVLPMERRTDKGAFDMLKNTGTSHIDDHVIKC